VKWQCNADATRFRVARPQTTRPPPACCSPGLPAACDCYTARYTTTRPRIRSNLIPSPRHPGPQGRNQPPPQPGIRLRLVGLRGIAKTGLHGTTSAAAAGGQRGSRGIARPGKKPAAGAKSGYRRRGRDQINPHPAARPRPARPPRAKIRLPPQPGSRSGLVGSPGIAVGAV